MPDLFSNVAVSGRNGYSAADIEILEGLEAVRRRPGMFVGGTDEAAMHHLVAEILDNAVDEALAGHANLVEITLKQGNLTRITDNGRGIPVDPHPQAPKLSALEVACTTLHAGGKFGNGSYRTAGGLHGVGLSAVNALSEIMTVEVVRGKALWRQEYVQGRPQGKLTKTNKPGRRRGTRIEFVPDPEIFQKGATLQPASLHHMACAKAQLVPNLEIRWKCEHSLIPDGDPTPASETLRFPGGLVDALAEAISERETVTPAPFAGKAPLPNGGHAEWAATWPVDEEADANSWCNTIPTPLGGVHETGFRSALVRGLKSHGERIKQKRISAVTAEDVTGGCHIMLSIFIEDPQFQGQTKERLVSPEIRRQVENAICSHFEHWLADDTSTADLLTTHCLERHDERQRRKRERATSRSTAVNRLRLPGKLADCSRSTANGSELFIVEGDSAGGSAKQARRRETQAVLALRGKILNVASASTDKLRENQELGNLVRALGCGTGDALDLSRLRYERIVIMTDADVDGAHIASLLLTFFLREMLPLVEAGKLYLAQPPLYRIAQGGLTVYARDDADRERLLNETFDSSKRVEISRFKGLGEMPAAQLRATTMDPDERTLIRVALASSTARNASNMVHDVMGRNPEKRLAFIRKQAPQAVGLDL